MFALPAQPRGPITHGFECPGKILTSDEPEPYRFWRQVDLGDALGFAQSVQMTTPRTELVDATRAMHYHLVSRCVRRAFLCGYDDYTGRDYSYRRAWIKSRLFVLAECFAVDVYAYAILSNHFHVVVRYDPTASADWSDAEVVDRWLRASPPSARVVNDAGDFARLKTSMLADEQLIARRRRDLGSLSKFVQMLKQPIASRANREDDVTGPFFAERFYSGALLDEAAVIAAMAYVDLNPVKAKLVRDIDEAVYTSIEHRLAVPNNSPERIEDYLRPVVSGLGHPSVGDMGAFPTASQKTEAQGGRPATSTSEYEYAIRACVASVHGRHDGPQSSTFVQHVWSIGRRQRAYGTAVRLSEWLTAREMRPLEVPLSGCPPDGASYRRPALEPT